MSKVSLTRYWLQSRLASVDESPTLGSWSLWTRDLCLLALGELLVEITVFFFRTEQIETWFSFGFVSKIILYTQVWDYEITHFCESESMLTNPSVWDGMGCFQWVVWLHRLLRNPQPQLNGSVHEIFGYRHTRDLHESTFIYNIVAINSTFLFHTYCIRELIWLVSGDVSNSFEQWTKKPWWFRLYRGWTATELYW